MIMINIKYNNEFILMEFSKIIKQCLLLKLSITYFYILYKEFVEFLRTY